MKLYVLEPTPNLAARLASRDVQLVGAADSFGALAADCTEMDFVLVSAQFPPSEIFRFLNENPRLAGRTVIVDIQERPSDILPFLEAGAAGYVRRDAGISELVTTLYEIRSGKPRLAPPIGDALLNRMHELLALQKQRASELLPADCDALEALTVRERQVLVLVRNGATNQDIANQLMIQVGTVKNHVHKILKKLNVTRREQAAQYVNLLEQIG